MRTPEAICDFGAGNGELCKLLTENYPNTKLICYEPAPHLLMEARQNLSVVAKVEFCQNINNVTRGAFDVVFCLEVFEHLPPTETVNVLETIFDLLKPGGKIVIGIPVEIGFPAFYKGVFRMLNRYGAFDANLKNIALSTFRHPPKNRPINYIAPGFRYHFEHMGFDYRNFEEIIINYFKLQKKSFSPSAKFGSWLMPEVYFLAEK